LKKIAIGLIAFAISVCANAFDHNYVNYDSVLKKYVENGLVNYSKLKAERTTIDDFVNELKSVRSSEYDSWNNDQQLAFWINAYNGWFLQIVIDHYPIKKQILKGIVYPDNSVQQIRGIWTEIKSKFAGQEVSLDTIEHTILRPQFREPRIHFSIVCASIGCPVLRNEAFRASELEKQLDDAARNFVNNPSKVQIVPAEKMIRISSIFDWFASDFAKYSSDALKQHYSKKEAGPIGLILKYVKPSDAKLITDGLKVKYLDYDWSLNEKK
jgi:hypothetical protein